ncbi:lamin tail domain-containing protein, partial [Pontiella sp.]|uniref:lamin tail domain-containing protein n=1 Tax=Pontiella sp. TaxID=2837462 RepID=UPI0035683F74
AQSEATSGATNAYPLIGDVVITEIMYHPADSNAFEYIELCNRTGSDVALYHDTVTSNVWKLSGAVDYSFPQGTVLAAGECLIISETNEAAFRSVYTVDAGVTVLGPYEGQLNNSGEDLYLTRPGDPEALTGEVPAIIVEWVDYDDEAPWPTTPDGLGASLERTDASLYPNDSSHWKASDSLTPGSFAGGDSDSLPDDWELEYFGSTSAGDDDDPDGDGASNYDEWRAGTDPANADSVFAFQSVEASEDCVFSWSSATGKVYSLWVSTNLVSGSFTLSVSPIPATPPINTFTAGVDAVECLYYKVSVEDE